MESEVIGGHFIFLAIKIGVLIFLFLYVIFAAIVIKQVKMMTETLEVGFENQLKIIVFLHFFLAMLILILSFFIL